MVFRFLCKTDCKKVNRAKKIAMERRKTSHELKETKELFLNNGLENLIFSGISANFKSYKRTSRVYPIEFPHILKGPRRPRSEN